MNTYSLMSMLSLSDEEIEEILKKKVKEISREEFEKIVKSNKDIFTILWENLPKLIKSKFLKNVITTFLRWKWDLIEKYLANPVNLYYLLWHNENLRDILKRKETIEWLNRTCEYAYKKLYDYVWGND